MKGTEAAFAFIHAHVHLYSVTELAKMTGVSRAGYYKWRARRGGCVQDQKDEEMLTYLKPLFEEHRGTYGRKRLKLALESLYGLQVNEKRISRLMRKYGLRCRIRQKLYRHRSQPHSVVPNLLERNFQAVRPGVKLAVDITYIRVLEGPQTWSYLCAVRDLFSGRIVGHAQATSQSTALVHEALAEVTKKGIGPGAIIHSDQGSQFTNPDYLMHVQQMGAAPSMSRRGNCWDNACIESFFGHLKCELPCFSEAGSVRDVQEAVTQYISYYNKKRIQTKRQESPEEFELRAS